MEGEDVIKKSLLKRGIKYGEFSYSSILNLFFIEYREIMNKSFDVKNIKSIQSYLKNLISEYNNKFINFSNEDIMSKCLHEYENIFGRYIEKQAKRKNPFEFNHIPKVCLRFAPNPSGPLHIAHSRIIVLNNNIRNENKGKIILRYEDTNPEKVDMDIGYTMEEDLKWLLGSHPYDAKFFQSDRFGIYHTYIHQAIKEGKAFCCTCMDIRKYLRNMGIACFCSFLSISHHLQLYKQMLNGKIKEKQAVIILKGDLNNKNPSLRDVALARIKNICHPRTKENVRLYPLLSLSVAIDDYLMGVNLIIRGKDHILNEERQKIISKAFNFPQNKFPECKYIGLVFSQADKIKTTFIREKISSGEYSGWDDPRTLSLKSFKRRKIDPRAIIDYWTEVGTTDREIYLDMDRIYAKEKKYCKNVKQIFESSSGCSISILLLNGSYKKIKIKTPNNFVNGKKYRVPNIGSIVCENAKNNTFILSNPRI